MLITTMSSPHLDKKETAAESAAMILLYMKLRSAFAVVF